LINAVISSDDEPFYDEVASDEEYSNLNNHGQRKRIKINKKSKKVEIRNDDFFKFFFWKF